MMLLNDLMFVSMLVCSSIDIRGFLDFKCSLSRNLIDFIKIAVIQELFICLNLLYFNRL